MKFVGLGVILLLLAISCNDVTVKTGRHILDFGSFTIETPDSWKKIENKIPYDAYVGSIAIDNVDTVRFELGWYSPDLAEYTKLNGDDSIFYLKEENPNEQLIYGDSLRIDSLIQSRFTWETINKRKAKIVMPKQSGKGTTGVFIDSLWKRGDNVDKFSIYGKNLKLSNEKQLLECIKTLKFYSE
jgi:hypothetical protein